MLNSSVKTACIALLLASSAVAQDSGTVVTTDAYGNADITILDPAEIDPRWQPFFEAAEEGRSVFAGGDYAGGIALLEPLADAGNPVAQNIVGLALTEAEGPLAPFYNWERGFAYLIAAAEQGFPLAQHNLGEFYEETHGDIAPNDEQLYRWHRRAADQGYVHSFYEVAAALANGDGVEQDIDAARVWADRALQGPERAVTLSLLGDLAYYGAGEPQDFAKALDLFLQSSEEGAAYGAFSAAYMYYFGEGTEVNDPEAVRLFKLALEGGEIGAAGYLTEAYRYGYGVEADPVQALAFADIGIARDDTFSMIEAGQIHLDGDGVPQDFDQARALFERVWALGNPDGLYLLGDMAYWGQGEPADREKAFAIYEEIVAVAPDHPAATYSIAFMKMRGDGTDQDIAAAVPLMERAWTLGERDALLELPVLYGSPDFAGDHSDPERALAACIAIDNSGRELLPERHFSTIAVCDALSAEASDAERAAAAALAETL